ncbi:MAG: hypothetical protein ACRCWO_12060 [Bosea sp. (in: a-proteobacteria)]
MGVLIYLPERPEAPRSVAAAKHQEAQIMFFTGVRYMRHEDASHEDTRHEDAQYSQAQTAAQGASSHTPRPRRRRG